MMVRGRKPLASAIKEASGAFAHDPQRRNKSEPKAKQGWPDMPDIIKADEIAKRKWNHVCKLLDEMNLLTTADSDLLEQYCLDYSQFRWLWEQVREGNVTELNDRGNASTKPAAVQIHKYQDRLLKRESELGLTPSARSRLHAPQANEEDPFQQWLDRAQGRSDN
jgi:P27 family predicted phage terminase small subunit